MGAIVRASHGVVLAAAAVAAVAGGALAQDRGGGVAIATLLVVAAIAVVVLGAVVRRLRFDTAGEGGGRRGGRVWPALLDFEVSLALAAGAYAMIALTGELSSPLYPLLYGLIAFSATFHSAVAAAVTVVAVLVLEAAAVARTDWAPAAVWAGAIHAAFVASAALLHAALLRGFARLKGRQHRRRLDQEIARLRETARDYRLGGTALGPSSRAVRGRAQEEELLDAGGAELVSGSVYYCLELLKRSLAARSCALLWMDGATGSLKVKELVADCDASAHGARVRSQGVVGAILRDRAAVTLDRARAGHVPYQGSGQGAFAGVPVAEQGHIRGVLCADRDEPFGQGEVDLLASAAEQIVRALQCEQVFRAVERSRYEHERFFHASARLGRALTVEQVMDTAFAAAAEIAAPDLAVITRYDAETARHRVVSARLVPGCKAMIDPAKLAGLEFRANSGLVSMVVKNKHYLPAGGEPRDSATPLFTKRVKLKEAASLLVLPLLSAEEAVGTLTLAARQAGCFGKDVREMLAVIANQVAISLENAMMYRRLETMATTDGLTGLTNHRAFHERLADLMRRAERHGSRVGVLLCDVDHFKRVNDRYGHPVGDDVLRKVAEVLRSAVRKIDTPARYGGEEFAVALEATDLAGALLLAERIRGDVAALRIDSAHGGFRVTMSVGVAVFPDDSRDQAELIERADLALYHAKESGRNRVVSYPGLAAARRRTTAIAAACR